MRIRNGELDAPLLNISFDESLNSLEDWDFLIMAADRGARFRYYDKVLALTRHHGDSMSRKVVTMCRARLTVFEKLASIPGGWSMHAETIQRLMAETHFNLGLLLLDDGEQFEARYHLRLGMCNADERIHKLALVGLILTFVSPPKRAAAAHRRLIRWYESVVHAGSPVHGMLNRTIAVGVKVATSMAGRQESDVK